MLEIHAYLKDAERLPGTHQHTQTCYCLNYCCQVQSCYLYETS